MPKAFEDYSCGRIDSRATRGRPGATVSPHRVLVELVWRLGALVTSAAIAHPHIFIDARTTITFNDTGYVTSIHHTWTLDEAYSAVKFGHGSNPHSLRPQTDNAELGSGVGQALCDPQGARTVSTILSTTWRSLSEARAAASEQRPGSSLGDRLLHTSNCRRRDLDGTNGQRRGGLCLDSRKATARRGKEGGDAFDHLPTSQ